MLKTRGLVIEAIHYLTYFAFFYGVFATIAYMISNNPTDILRAGLMLVPAFIYFFLRRVAASVGYLLLIHSIIPVLLAVVLPRDVMTILWVAIAALLAVHSVVFVFRKTPTDAASFIVPCAIVFTFLSIWAIRAGNLQLTALYPFLMAILVIGRILLLRMTKMDRSLEAMQLSYKQPIEQIIAFDYKLAAGVVLALVAIAVAIYFLLIAPLANALAGALASTPEIDFDGGRGLPEGSPYFPQERIDDMLDLLEPRTFRFWELLSQIVLGIFSLGIVALIIYAMFRFVLFLLSYRSGKKNILSDSADIIDEREFILPKSGKRRRRLRSALAELHPIRRLFKETAKKHIKMGVPIKKSDTPTEITKRIQSEDISNLSEEYAQVRYKNLP